MSTTILFHVSTTAVVLLILVSVVSGTDHIVGANKGWNPGLNYTLWAHNHTFYVGDFISFRYQKNQYNVFEVNQTGYDNCTMDGATGNWSSGKDFILLNKAKRYFFICGTGGCFSGMKVSILVHNLPSPPRAVIAAQHSSDSMATHGSKGKVSRIVRIAMGVILSFVFGCGWI